MADERPNQQPPRWDPSRSHVPDLESFLQQLYVDQFVSVEPTSAQFSALSARVAVLSTLVGVGGAGSATSDEVSVLIAKEVSDRTSAISAVLKGKWSVVSSTGTFTPTGTGQLVGTSANEDNYLQVGIGPDGNTIYFDNRAGQATMKFYNKVAAWNMDRADTGAHWYPVTDDIADIGKATQRARDLYLGRNLQVSGTISAPIIDTLSNAISVLSNQISALSQSHSVLSNAVSALSVAVSVVSATLASVQSNVAAVSATLASVISQVSLISANVAANSATLTSVQSQVSLISATLASVQSQVSAISARISTVPPVPGCRLTLQTGVPVMVTQTLAALSVLYTPYLNDQVPIYKAGTTSAWSVFHITETSMSLDSSAHTSATNYDVFAVNDGGTFRIGSGPAWSSDTARATSIQQKDGIYTNMSTVNLRYGSLWVSVVSANTATYLGTFRTTSVAGQTEYSFGSAAASAVAANLLLWNMYNRVEVAAMVLDSTTSWTYQTATWRAANASNTARVNFVRGLNEDSVQAIYAGISNPTSTASGANALALDATGGTGLVGTHQEHYRDASSIISGGPGMWSGFPGLGFHFLQSIEISGNVTAALTWYGTQAGGDFGQSGLSFLGVF